MPEQDFRVRLLLSVVISDGVHYAPGVMQGAEVLQTLTENNVVKLIKYRYVSSVRVDVTERMAKWPHASKEQIMRCATPCLGAPLGF